MSALSTVMQVVALVILVAAGAWLVGVALLMAFAPDYGLHLMEKMAAGLERSSWRLQFTEQGLRVVVGLALIVRAPASKLPPLFEVAGWVLVGTSLIIMVAPIRWHAAYGRMLLTGLRPLALRILSPVPGAAGVGLIYMAL